MHSDAGLSEEGGGNSIESGSSPRVKSLPTRYCLQNMGEELVEI